MNFRLKNKGHIFLLEEDFRMSNFFADLFRQHTLDSLVGNYLGDDALTKVAPGLAKASATFRMNDIIYVPATQASFLALLRETCEKDATSVIDRIAADYNTIFYIEYSIEFIPDPVFVDLVRFMRLDHRSKSAHMFDHLPDLYRQNSAQDLETLLDNDTRVFLDFLKNKPRQHQEQLVAAACQIDLRPLIDLYALCIASASRTQTEEEFRRTYDVPEKFANAIMSKLATTVPVDDVWASLLVRQVKKQKVAPTL
jgi:hypothetical protein